MTTTTLPKINTRQSFFKLFFKGKVGTVKIKLLTFDTRFRYYDIPTKPLSRMTTLSRFPAKMTLVHAGALLGIEKISYS